MARRHATDGTVGDGELVRAARAGDQRAFAELYRRHVDGVVALAAARLRDRSAAHDVAHEAFAAVLPRLEQLRDVDRFGAWVRTVAANQCVAMNRVRQPDAPLVTDLRDDVSEPPDRVVERRETVEAVHAALGELSHSDRELLVLRDLQERRLGEVAEVRGLTYGSAEVAMARARGRLRAVCERLELLVGALVAGVWRRLTGRADWLTGEVTVRLIAVAVPAVVVGAALLLDGNEPLAGGPPAGPRSAVTVTVSATSPGRSPSVPAATPVTGPSSLGTGDSAGVEAEPAGRPPAVAVPGLVKVSRSRPDRAESFAARATIRIGEDGYATGVSGGYDDLDPPVRRCDTPPVNAAPHAGAGEVAVGTELRHRPC
jgi:RNA polymerase sigma-70 factor (ECF subfamily)